MWSFKQIAYLAGTTVFSCASMAKQPIADADLRHVDGRDGVNITADLDVKVASYTRTTSGGSWELRDFKVVGGVDVTLDDLTKSMAINELSSSGILGNGGPGAAAFAPTGDVVKATLNENPSLKPLNISVGSLTMGNAPDKSFGAVTINQADLRGTAAYIWAR